MLDSILAIPVSNRCNNLVDYLQVSCLIASARWKPPGRLTYHALSASISFYKLPSTVSSCIKQ